MVWRVKSRISSYCKYISFAIFSFLMCITSVFVGYEHKQDVGAFTISGMPATCAVLWDSANNCFDSDECQRLFDLISGESGTSIDDLDTLAYGGNTSNFYGGYSCDNWRGNGVDYGSDDLCVEIGEGLFWTPTYLSHDKNGNVILYQAA